MADLMKPPRNPREDRPSRFQPFDEDLMLSKVGRDLTYKAQESTHRVATENARS